MKRTLALLLCLAMLLSYLPGTLFSASADDAVTEEDSDISIPADPNDVVEETTVSDSSSSDASESTPAVHTAYCAACDDNVVWTAVTSGTQISSANDTHFYLSEDCTYTGSLPVISVEAGAVCVDLNGHTLTTSAEINVKGVLNIQGEGSVFGNNNKTDIDFDDLINAGQGSVAASSDTALINIASADAEVNIYGGTYSVVNNKPIVAYTEAGSLNLLGGEIDGTVSGDNLTLGGAAKVTLIETSKLTVKSDWTGSAVVNPAVLETGVAEGNFTGSLKTPQGRKMINDNGALKVSVLVNNPVQEAALDMVFPTDGSDYTAVCPACGEEVVWKAVTDGNAIRRGGGTHRYMAEDSTVTGSSSFLSHWSENQDDVLCLHLNGKTINTSGYIDASKSILNIMGDGVVNCNGAAGANGIAVINVTHSGADTHLYGGTYVASGDAAYSLNFKAAGTVTSYEGVTFVGKVNAPVGKMFAEYGSVHGVQGENITWTFTDGVLSVSGTGAVTAEADANVSWYALNYSVKTINIGAGITDMDDSALAGTTVLEAFNVDAGNATYTSVDGVLYTKDQSTLLMVPGMLAGEITIPATVTTIDEAAFYNATQLTAINVDPANENYSSVDGVLFNKDQSKLIRFPAKKAGTYNIPEIVTSIAPYAFAYCDVLTAVTVPNSVTEMGENTFRDAIALETLTLSENLDAIPAYMCYGCELLTNAVVHNGVTEIGTYAFAGSGVIEITIPATVTAIGKFAFTRTALKDVYYGSNQESWEEITYEPNTATGVVDELEAATIHYYVPPVITGITVTAPTKVDYELGEELVLDGMTVTGVYSDETTAPITEGYEVSGFDSETAGTKTITVTYGEFTATFEVTVKEAAPEVVLNGIEVTTMPKKVTYMAGSTFDATGMVVTATYSDGTTAAITDYTVDVDLSTAGTKTVTVTSGEFTATFTVTVLENADFSIALANVTKGISITWDNAGVEMYTLYARSFVDGQWTDWAKLGDTTAQTYLYTANEGVQYEFKIEAKIGTMITGEAYSGTITRLVATTVAVVNDITGIRVTWKEDAAADAYYVYRRPYQGATPIGEWEKIAETTDADYLDENVENGTMYGYTVRVLANSALSAEATAATLMRLDPVSLTIDNVAGEFVLKWDANPVATKYFIYRREQVNNEWTTWTRTSTLSVGYSDLNVKNGVLYQYRVVALYGADTSAENVAPVEQLRLTLPALSGTNQAEGIFLSWKENTAAEKYNLYKSEYINGSWTPWGEPILVTTDLQYMDTNTVNGVKYRYTVRTVNGEYISGYKDGAVLYRLETPIVHTESVSGGIGLSWTANDAATKYFIYVSQLVDGQWTAWKQFISVPHPTNTYTFYGTEGGVYRFMSRANKDDIESQPTATQPITYLIPCEVWNVESTAKGMHVRWKLRPDISTYELYRRTKNADGSYGEWEFITKTTTELEYYDTTAEKGNTYQYTVRSVDYTYKCTSYDRPSKDGLCNHEF